MLKLEDLSQFGIEHAIQDFYKTMSNHVAGIVWEVAHYRYSIPRERRRLGNAEFQYYFAADLDLVFRYALGGVEASGTLIETNVQKIVDLLETSPAGGRCPLDWEKLVETPMGIALKGAMARVKLRREAEPLTSDEICLLAGWNPQKLASAKIEKVSKKSGLYEPGSVKEAFGREKVKI